MKKTFLIIIFLLLVLSSCQSGWQSSDPSLSGTAASSDNSVTTVEAVKKEVPSFDDFSEVSSFFYSSPDLSDEREIANFGGNGKAFSSSRIINVRKGDLSEYDFVGTARSLVSDLVKKGVSARFYNVLHDETSIEVSLDSFLNDHTFVAVKEVRETDDFYSVYFSDLPVHAGFYDESLNAESGTYMTLDFYSDFETEFAVSVSASEDGIERASSDVFIPSRKESETRNIYNGRVTFTLPFLEEGSYYISLFTPSQPFPIASVPVNITPGKYADRTQHLFFEGNWESVENYDAYCSDLLDLFYDCYPRIKSRFDLLSSAPDNVIIRPAPDYEGLAYSYSDTVVVSSKYASENPDRIGFFAHELTHIAQNFKNFKSSWWSENTANYSEFRYFSWLVHGGKYAQIFNPDDPTVREWDFEPFGVGSKLFFAYVDYLYPTHKEDDGGTVYGLIDSVNFAIENGSIEDDSDPYDKTSAISLLVSEISEGRFESIGEIRDSFESEILEWRSGNGESGWWFFGFSGYEDNFVIENLPGLENPRYPTYDPLPIERGLNSGLMLPEEVLDGWTNLSVGGEVISYSGLVEGCPAENVIDGDSETIWLSDEGHIIDYMSFYKGISGYIIIDLGSESTFNTYTLSQKKARENAAFCESWDVLVSEDGVNWTLLDTQTNGGHRETESFFVGNQSARYVQLRLFKFGEDDSCVCISEFMLFNVGN